MNTYNNNNNNNNNNIYYYAHIYDIDISLYFEGPFGLMVTCDLKACQPGCSSGIQASAFGRVKPYSSCRSLSAAGEMRGLYREIGRGPRRQHCKSSLKAA